MRKIKNITIVVLIVTTFIQLSYIWSISVPDFFATSNEAIVKEEYKKDILAPNKVYIKQGDNFKMAYSTKENTTTNRGVVNLLNEVVNNGEYVENTKPLNELLYDIDEVFCYPSTVSKELLVGVLNYKGNNLNKIDLSFNYLYVDEDGKEVYFFNSESEEIVAFSIANFEKVNIPKGYIFNKNIEYKYDETSQVNNDIFFTPVVTDVDYVNISVTKPYTENNETLVSTVEPKINSFFKSPNEKWTIWGDDSYIFSGEDITVKYYYNNILEYRNNKDSSKKTDIDTAFAIAKSYIETDEYVTNDLILKHFETVENSYKFCFNPVVNNTEVVFENEFINYYIEIEVKNGIVTQYKKQALNYNQEFQVTDIADSYTSIFELKQNFNDVEIVYLQNVDDIEATLHWAMSFNNNKVYTKAQLD